MSVSIDKKQREHSEFGKNFPFLIRDCLEAILSIDALQPKQQTFNGIHGNHENQEKSKGTQFISGIKNKRNTNLVYHTSILIHSSF